MEFTANNDKPNYKVNLTLEPRKLNAHGRSDGCHGEMFLKANGRIIMGFYDGKYRLYSHGDIDGLCNERGIIQCHNPETVT